MPGQLNPASAGRYNLLILGGGPAGLATAIGAASLGARVALVEKGEPGGDTLFAGSVPSKALLRAARAAAEIRRAPEFGIRTGPGVVDFPAVRQRLREVQGQIGSGSNREALLQAGVDIYTGEGRFTDSSHVEVGGRVIAFSRAVIATGSRPAVPAITGIEAVAYLTSDTLFQLDRLPQRLGIIGAGPFGCEMAQVFTRFGCEVAVFEQAGQCLPEEDEDAAAIVQTALQQEGVRFHLGCRELRVERQNGSARLQGLCAEGGVAETVDGLLVAAGRTPNIERLNLDAAGVEADATGIHVSSFLRTTSRRIFAAGDVCSRYHYTHAADALARVVIANALFFGTDRASNLLVPRCTYTEPELAHVGVTDATARAANLRTLALPLDDLDHTILEGTQPGLVKIHHDMRGLIRGATIVAANAGELIGAVVLAMNHGIKLGSLAADIFPYPTESEIFRTAGDIYRNAMLTPAITKLFKRFLGWRR